MGSLDYVGDSARVTRDGQVIIDWTSGGTLQNIPQGDGYRLEIMQGGRVTAEALAVGTIVLTLGQSNMVAWYDSITIAPRSEGGYLYSGGTVRPLGGVGTTAFANGLIPSTDAPILFVNASVGGTALLPGFGSNWLQEGPGTLYGNALSLLAGLGGRAEIVLWNQGEADASRNVSTAAYADGLRTLFGRILADINPELILISGLAHPSTNSDRVRAAQAQVADELDAVVYVATPTDIETLDGTHLSIASREWQAGAAAREAAIFLTGSSVIDPDIVGTSGIDMLQGTASRDRITAGSGDDVIYAGADRDVVRGGTGNDSIFGEAGDDMISGGTGNDTVDGGDGNDEIYGDSGDDRLIGGAGDDYLIGGAGADILEGGAGNDRYFFDSQDTIIETSAGGIDTVLSDVGFVLADGVENGTLRGSTTVGITGNGLDNTLTGNHGANLLAGLNGSDRLIGNGGDDQLNGGAGSDVLDGGAGVDTAIFAGLRSQFRVYLNGSTAFVDDLRNGRPEGLDTLISIEQVQFLDGTFALSSLLIPGASIFGTSGNDTITLTQSVAGQPRATDLADHIDAGGGDDTVSAGGGDDVVMAGAGNDRIDGGAGIDTMDGGLGDDVFVVDHGSDNVIERLDEGYDTVESSINYQIGTHIEALRLIGTLAINGTGNDDANSVTGNTADNSLSGLGGDDALNGSDGNDLLNGGAGSDVLDGGSGTDTAVFTGMRSQFRAYLSNGTAFIEDLRSGRPEGVDTLIGIEQVQFLDGTFALSSLFFPGASIFGTSGSDTITLTQSVVGQLRTTELADYIDAGAGDDVIAAGNGDDLILAGAGNDRIDGGAGDDTMDGGLGDDTFIVDHSADVIIELFGQGTDAVEASVSYQISANIEALRLVGTLAINGTGNDEANTISGNNADNTLYGLGGDDTLIGGVGNDVLLGGAGNDLLIGGTGADILDGGLGDDTYSISDTLDIVIESAGGGFDRVNTMVQYTLTSNVEALFLLGNVGISGTGNGIANQIYGNGAANVLSGLGGDDLLSGGAGTDTLLGGDGNDRLLGGAFADVLTGGAGADVFVLDVYDGRRDTITDFVSGIDRIEIVASAFGVSTLGPPQLLIDVAAPAGAAALVYSTRTGLLTWDADGTGGAATVQIAVLNQAPVLTAADLNWI